jgi:hypothetical protein
MWTQNKPTMTMRFFVAGVLLVASSVAEDDAQTSTLPPCRFMTPDTVPKYHTDDTCDRAAHNSYEKVLMRDARYKKFLKTGISHVPDQLTVVCPEQPVHLTPANGHNTKWIVENKSSRDAVVLFVKDGVEHSAFGDSITPPQANPKAVLKPGDWMAVETFEGHVFYVREVLADGSTGNILLQHRPGLIGFTNRFQKDLDCDDYEDVEPIVKVYPKAPPKENKVKVEPIIKTSPEFERTPDHRTERCHIVYQGFRNLLPNCPLNVHYVGMQEATNGPMECKEAFKFHLGLKDDTRDYMNDWNSRTKFEATFVGHTFSARLATNPDIVVDSFTLQPTEIHDCPGLEQKAIAQQHVIEANGIQHGIQGQLNVTNMDDSLNVTSLFVGMGAASGFK